MKYFHDRKHFRKEVKTTCATHAKGVKPNQKGAARAGRGGRIQLGSASEWAAVQTQPNLIGR